MLVLMLVILIVTWMLVYLINGKKILTPTSITIFIYILGTFFAIIGSSKWTNIEFNPLTIFFVLISILFMELGELFSKRIKINESKNAFLFSSKTIKINCFIQIIFLMISFFSAYLYFRRVMQIATSVGYSGIDFLYYVRLGLSSGEEKHGVFLVLLMCFSDAWFYFTMYCFFNNMLLKEKKFKIYNLLYLLSAIPVFIIAYLSSSRYLFVKYVVYLIICFYCLKIQLKPRNNGLSFKTVFKVSIVGLLSFFVIYGLYILVGQSRGSFSLNSPIDKFIMYGGSSIYGLSDYISRGCPSSNFFGEETLVGFFSLLKRFFPDLSISGKSFMESFQLSSSLRSNVYLMIRNLIADYTFPGMLICEFIIGVIFGYEFNKISNISYKKSPLNIIILSYFSYGLVFQLFAALMTSDIFSIRQIFDLVFIYIFYILFKMRIAIASCNSSLKFHNKIEFAFE